jgi:hypothetical protein
LGLRAKRIARGRGSGAAHSAVDGKDLGTSRVASRFVNRHHRLAYLQENYHEFEREF